VNLNPRTQLFPQAPAVGRLELEHGQTGHSLDQTLRGGAEARTYLQDVLAQLDVAQTEGQQLLVDPPLPPAG
jgi:ABC-type hemin transport system ATPase subunit